MVEFPQPKSFYISLAVSYFSETESDIWTGLGLAGSTENFCNFTKVPYF
jgi:hypothetical protein